MADTIDGSGFSFGVPPSLGAGPAWQHARELAGVLYDHGFTTVIPFRTYDDLERALRDGEVDAAWGPPLVCARIEAAGGTVALRGVRDGATTYRSVLVSRVQDAFELEALGKGAFRPRAVWVDKSSIGGYLLARAYLRQRGLELGDAFLHQHVLGSYAACIEAVLGFDADVTALFVGQRGLGDAWGTCARRLRPLGYTAEAPNDGVVVASTLDPDRLGAVIGRLEAVLANPQASHLFASTLSVDSFDRPPRDTYTPLLALM